VKSTNCDQCSTCRKTVTITFNGYRIVATGSNITINGVALDANQGYVNGRML